MISNNQKTYNINTYNFVKKFKCLADKCPDVCCYGWTIPVEKKINKLYRKQDSELADSIICNKKLEFKKNENTGFCINLENKLCKIHKNHGTEFLPDSCYFYPKVIKNIGNSYFMTGLLSCYEITRLVFLEDENIELESQIINRIPENISNLLPGNIEEKSFWEIHNLFLKIIDNNKNNVTSILIDLMNLSKSIDNTDISKWLKILKNYKYKKIEYTKNSNDIYYLINLLVILIRSTDSSKIYKITRLLNIIESKLNIKIDFDSAAIDVNILDNNQNYIITNENIQIENIINKYIITDIKNSLFPFSNNKYSNLEKFTFLLIKTYFVKLSLICSINDGNHLDEEIIISNIQTISKFFDHLENLDLLFLITRDYNWDKENRLISLIYCFKNII